MYHKYSGNLKYYKRLGIYKNASNTNYFNPKTLEAYSYNWWKYLHKEGKLVIFNSCSYSMTTNKHQYALCSLLKQLKIKIHLEVNSVAGLQSPDWKHEVYRNIYKDLFLAEYKLTKKGLRDKTKKQLKENVKNCLKKLNKLKVIKCPLTKSDLIALSLKVIKQEEIRLTNARLEAQKLREKRKAFVQTVATELNNMNSIDLYNNYDKLNNMESI